MGAGLEQVSKDAPADDVPPAVERGRPGLDDEEFRADAVRTVLWALPCLVVAIAASFIVDYAGTPIGLAALIPGLLVLTIAGHRLVQRHVTA
ncbi:MAG: hypothetical protein ACRDIY_10870, partial [Chloroflexota bacterium]